MMYKAIHNLSPPYICDLVSRYLPTRNLRSSQDFLLYSPLISSSHNRIQDFSRVSPLLWNPLPQHIRLSPTIETFKKNLKNHLFRQAYSLQSPIWNNVDPSLKAKLNTDKDEGEFWISISDFLIEYSRVQMCDVTMNELCGGANYDWYLTEFNGEWKLGSTSGGNSSLDTFCINPQYKFTLRAPGGDTSKMCPVVLSLLQKDRRKIKFRAAAYISLGFYIYKLSSSDVLPLGKTFFKNNKCVSSEATYDNTYREAAKRLDLLPGDYVIVPANETPADEAAFYLRIFTKEPTGAQEPGNSTLTAIFQPVLTPETDSEFDIVNDELQKGEFDENDVKDMLNKMLAKYPELKSAGLTIKAVQDLIKLMDVDNSKTLSVDEFKKTWLKVDNYWRIFQSADDDKSATLSATEFRNALENSGFNFNISILNAIVDKVGPDSLKLDFNVFISTVANLETLFKMFNLMNPNQGGSINLSLDEIINVNTFLPNDDRSILGIMKFCNFHIKITMTVDSCYLSQYCSHWLLTKMA
ncbi:unnamed protein product [Ranitomeya imitator]|uniref:Uncharacterized protein n=1 Tax=Ranitomeya imitator TaxID=111125 RepID=A0ABN9M279_9NEOB|nr:unnamed protein product [Ranitomeya imitator]